MTVNAPTERNFRRVRVKPAKRHKFRPQLSRAVLRRVLMVMLMIVAVHQTVSFAFTTPLLRVKRIAVRGNVRLSSGEVQALVEDLRGSSIIGLDLDAFRRRLNQSPWVANVALRRVLPGTIEVFVSERRPVGLCRLGQDLYLVDDTGVVIDQYGPQYAEFDLPIIDGLVNTSGVAGQGAIDPRRAELAARAIASIARNAQISSRLSQIDVTDVSNAVILLEGDTALLHLGTDQFLERVQAYLDLSAALRERVADIDYVDLRFDQRVYVRPARDERQPSRRRPERGPAIRRF